MEANISLSKIRLEMENPFFAKENIRAIKVSLTRSFLQQQYYTRADVINSYRPACATCNIVFLDITKYDVTFWNRCLKISEIE